MLMEQSDKKFLKNAAFKISNTRPTTKNRMEKITKGSLDRAVSAMKSGKCVYEELFNDAVDSLNRRYKTMSVVGENLANLFLKNGKVMTQYLTFVASSRPSAVPAITSILSDIPVTSRRHELPVQLTRRGIADKNGRKHIYIGRQIGRASCRERV